MGTIELERTFLDARNLEENDPESFLYSALASNKLLRWEALRQFRIAVILGECGTGKTTELKAEAVRLRRDSMPVFCAALEDLASDGLVDSIDLETAEGFKRWLLSDSGVAFFFLDSLDEAKLRNQTLSKALRKLGKELGAQIKRAKLVITCRVSDWSPVLDLEIVETFAGKSEEVVVVQISPLTPKQVRDLAIHEGVQDISNFEKAIAASSAQGFAERPLDVAWLAAYWKKHGKLGTLTDLVVENIHEKLKERVNRNSTLAKIKSENALEKLAGVASISNLRSFLLPDGSDDFALKGHSLDCRQVLPELSDSEVAQLCSLAIFDESTYGRIRIHHRMAHEYLAARWFWHLTEEGLSTREFEALIFCDEARQIVRPHLIPVVGWLCLWNEGLRDKIAATSPQILISEGDPSGLPVKTRKDVLRRYASKFEDRERLFYSFDSASLGRFATESLTSCINELLLESVDELSSTLLSMVKTGKLNGCLPDCLRIAGDERAGSRSRYEAMSAIAEIADEASLKQLASILERARTLEAEIAAGFLRTLYPATITLEDLMRTLAKVEPSAKNRFDALDHFLQYQLLDRTPDLLREQLLKSFNDLFLEPKTGVSSDHWLLEPFGNIVSAFIQQDMGPESEELKRALKLFQKSYSQGLHVASGVDDVKDALRKAPKARRLMFWEAVSERRKSGKKSLRFLDTIEAYSLFDISQLDYDWLAEDALKRVAVADRLLAFDVIASIPVAEGERANRLSKLRELAEQDPAIKKRFHRMLNPLVSHAGFVPPRYQLVEKARQIRREKTRAKHRDDLTGILAQLRDGTHWNGLWFLYVRSQVNGYRITTVDFAKIQNLYGEEISSAFKEGLRKCWSQIEPGFPHQRERRSEIPVCVVLGLAGANLTFDEEFDVLSLSSADARKLAIYALNESNEFPDWLQKIAEAFPGPVLDVLFSSLSADYVQTEVVWGVLEKLPRSSVALRKMLLPTLIRLLHLNPPRNEPLIAVLETVLGVSGSEAKPLSEIFAFQCAQPIANLERFAGWWVCWLVVDSSSALDFMEKLQQSYESFDQLAVECCHRIYEWTEPYSSLKMEILLETQVLRRLFPIVMTNVLEEEDLNHEGVYTPEKRDHAETIRSRLFSAAVESAPQLSDVFQRLASEPKLIASRDWLLAQAERGAARGDCCAPMTPSEAISWANSRHHQVKDGASLFRVVVDRLDDIRLFIERDDHSYRDLFTSLDDGANEAHAQSFLTSELKRRAKSQYTVSREEEGDRYKKPDIRVSNPVCSGPVSVEVKIAENWTFEQLLDSLRGQLVGQYLREVHSRSGVFMLCSIKKQRQWRSSVSDKLVDFPELVAELAKIADEICKENVGVDFLITLGIDFH